VHEPADIPEPAALGMFVGLTAKAVQDFVDSRLEQGSVTPPAWVVLHHLARQPGLTSTALSELICVELSTLTHHVQRLESDGMVVRHRSASDGRQQTIKLTAKGKRTESAMHQQMVDIDRQLQSLLTEREVAQLSRLLVKLRNKIDSQENP
jgi:MarR family transcriptional regulator for hemolysin